MKKPSDPHWADIFEAGMKDALDGKPEVTTKGHYWKGYTYGLAVKDIEAKREREAIQDDRNKTPSDQGRPA